MTHAFSDSFLTVILLLLIVATLVVRYLELRDLVRSIGKQTEALSLYLGEQAHCRTETGSALKQLQDTCARIETKVDYLHREQRKESAA